MNYNKETTYENGFGNDNRKDISFIISGNSMYGKENKLTIKAKQSIEIHFEEILEDLDGYFDKDMDEKVQNIVSIDFSYFDTTLIASLQKTFYGCSSLTSIDLSYFYKSNLYNTCNMFNGCSSLQRIDIPNIDMSKTSEASNMFSSLTSLKYLNIKGIKVNFKNKKTLFEDLKESSLTVCQDENPILKGSKIKSNCCYFYKDACPGN